MKCVCLCLFMSSVLFLQLKMLFTSFYVQIAVFCCCQLIAGLITWHMDNYGRLLCYEYINTLLSKYMVLVKLSIPALTEISWASRFEHVHSFIFYTFRSNQLKSLTSGNIAECGFFSKNWNIANIIIHKYVMGLLTSLVCSLCKYASNKSFRRAYIHKGNR